MVDEELKKDQCKVALHREADGYCKEAEKYISAAVLMLTSACNLRCDYCFEADHSIRHMSRETVFQSIKWLLSCCKDKAGIILFGGEPLLCKDMIPWLLTTARTEADRAGKGLTFSISTNGTLFDETIGCILKEAKTHIRLSADGTAAGHDVHRRFPNNRGSFHMVDRAIPLIQKACFKPSIRMTITPQNVHDMANGVEYFVKRGFDSVLPVPVQEAEWTTNSLRSYASNLERAAVVFIQQLLQGRIVHIYGITDIISRAVVSRNTYPCGAGTYPCGAGRTLVAIDVDGSIYPCQRFIGYTSSDPYWRLGNIWDGLNGGKRDFFYQTTTDKMQGCHYGNQESSSGGCHECSIFYICRGGCMAINYLVAGNPLKPSPSYWVLKTIAIDVAHTVVKYLETNYRAIWDECIYRGVLHYRPIERERSHKRLCEKTDVNKYTSANPKLRGGENNGPT